MNLDDRCDHGVALRHGCRECHRVDQHFDRDDRTREIRELAILEATTRPEDDATERLIARLRARAVFGLAKYGKALLPFDGRNSLEDALDEALDLSVYIEKEIIIGIDPATKCGWAVLDAKGLALAGGTWRLERRSGDGAGMCYVRFQRLFTELLDAYPAAIVGYEQQANRFAGSAHIGLGIIAHLQRICEERQTPYTGIAFSTVKKIATGSGAAKKDKMVAAACARWAPVEDDNHADALWIAEAVRGGFV